MQRDVLRQVRDQWGLGLQAMDPLILAHGSVAQPAVIPQHQRYRLLQTARLALVIKWVPLTEQLSQGSEALRLLVKWFAT